MIETLTRQLQETKNCLARAEEKLPQKEAELKAPLEKGEQAGKNEMTTVKEERDEAVAQLSDLMEEDSRLEEDKKELESLLKEKIQELEEAERKLAEVKGERDVAEEESAKEKARLEETEALLQELQKQQEESREALEAFEQKLREKEEALATASSRAEGLEKRLEEIHGEYATLRDKAATLGGRLKETFEKLGEATTRAELLDAQLKGKEADMIQAAEKVKSLEELLASKDTELSSALSRLAALESSLREGEGDLAALGADKSRLIEEKNRLAEEKSELESDKKRLEMLSDERAQEINHLQKKLSEVIAERDSAKEEVKKARERESESRDGLEGKLRAKEEELTALSARVSTSLETHLEDIQNERGMLKVEAALPKADSRLADGKSQLEAHRRSLEERTEERQQDIKHLQSRLSEVEAERDAAIEEGGQLKRALEEGGERVRELENLLSGANQQSAQLEQRILQMEATASTLELELKETQQSPSVSREEGQRLETSVRTLEGELSRCRAGLASAERSIETLHGGPARQTEEVEQAREASDRGRVSVSLQKAEQMDAPFERTLQGEATVQLEEGPATVHDPEGRASALSDHVGAKLVEISDLEGTLSALRTALQTAESDQRLAALQLAESTSECQRLASELETERRSAAARQEEARLLSRSLDALNSETASLSETLAESQTRMHRLQVSLENAEAEKSSLLTELGSVRASSLQALESLEASLREARAAEQSRTAELRGTQEAAAAAQKRHESEMQSLRGKLESSEASLMRAEISVREARDGAERLKSELISAQASLASTQRVAEDKTAACERMEKELVASQESLRGARKEVVSLHEQCHALQRAVEAEAAEKVALQEGTVQLPERAAHLDEDISLLQKRLAAVTVERDTVSAEKQQLESERGRVHAEGEVFSLEAERLRGDLMREAEKRQTERMLREEAEAQLFRLSLSCLTKQPISTPVASPLMPANRPATDREHATGSSSSSSDRQGRERPAGSGVIPMVKSPTAGLRGVWGAQLRRLSLDVRELETEFARLGESVAPISCDKLHHSLAKYRAVTRASLASLRAYESRISNFSLALVVVERENEKLFSKLRELRGRSPSTMSLSLSPVRVSRTVPVTPTLPFPVDKPKISKRGESGKPEAALHELRHFRNTASPASPVRTSLSNIPLSRLEDYPPPFSVRQERGHVKGRSD
uniref:Uncharacterized protein n=1 Tax=Chromera velia CCMP2878 TaxID=1169474 RepID=A0A0G4HNX4_9ALVE|eukprot:Cvel_1201.t1-p1 / transcript=Cvel_1201.t1 / gene=Cvel_1201 / organism=Chromera_velia_CCMP2878 / gene_product=Myosin-7B, putative / transcript_product=Myosin-7B, putative / location=Cvel_scaffold40:26651-30614(-) / protein_length=1192 / sequence_SO=supercontig / SO=protein_coding / is_pseudo=false